MPHTLIQWRGLHSSVTESQILEVYKSRMQDMNHEKFLNDLPRHARKRSYFTFL